MDAPPNRPSWDYRRGTAGVRLILAVAADHGVTAEACLAGSGVDRADLDDPDRLIEAGQELAIARNLLRSVGDRPGLGVEAGRRYTVGALGLWGFALMASPTVREALRLGVRYAQLSFAFIQADFAEDRRGGHVVLGDAEIPADARGFFVERELTKIVSLAPVAFGRSMPLRVETTFTGARARALHRALPEVELVGGAAAHVLHLPPAVLDQPLPQADAATVRALERDLTEMLGRRHEPGTTVSRVRAMLLTSRAATGLPAIAARMHVHPRTLRRRLADEGTTFRALRDEVHETLARNLLVEAGLSVQEVAAHLGYNDAAAFSHAFKRWTGTTPGSLRGA
ncbi:AraC family transcriptional regulator [Patulibacter defluvii]|uniref:AraC family transcriptional regulator n=1 Tax=Patulibacter defluvii TaxID=3095358 RepID=UPI002A75144A|nr:AraC family transcriptional regulator [Patulibacter sp. DM4]